MKVRFLLLALFAMEPLMAAETSPLEGRHPRPAAAPGDYPCQLFLPRGYPGSGKQPWPLLIFLHGSGQRDTACALKDMPVGAFHGDTDDIVPPIGNFAMVEAIRACKGSVFPRLTLYPGFNHGAWVPACDDPALYRWLLE